MYSEYIDLEISRKHLYYLKNNGKTLTLNFNVQFNPLDTIGIYLTKEGMTVECKANWIMVKNKDNKTLQSIYMPIEVKAAVQKDLFDDGIFDINYRKHLRWKYSKKFIHICFVGMNIETLDFFNHHIKEAYKICREYSRGVDKRAMVIISPAANGINYKILRCNIECKRGFIGVSDLQLQKNQILEKVFG